MRDFLFRLMMTSSFLLTILSPTLSAQAPDSLLRRFAYDRELPFQLDRKVSFVYTTPEVSLYALTDTARRADTLYHVRITLVEYQATDSTRAAAWITEPVTSDSLTTRPALVLQHWGEGNKDAFLSEAVDYSRRGFVCLLPDAVWLSPGTKFVSFSRQGYHLYHLGVINLLRGLDLLEQLYPLDEKNIFYIGHSYGAGLGAILTGIEPRFDAFVLMTGVYSVTKTFAVDTRPDIAAWREQQPEAFRNWLTWMRPLDAELYLPHKTAPVLLQFANQDEYIEAAHNEVMAAGTPQPKEVKYYDTRHALDAEARRDRWAYLLRQVKK